MSNNIHNTKVDKIKQQVYNLLEEYKTNKNTEELESKYSYLYSTSKTLFNFVIKESSKSGFNKTLFDNNLTEMLKHIILIQKDEMSQNTASENIGKLLATQFIPQYKN
jgi:uncharacterized protein YutD